MPRKPRGGFYRLSLGILFGSFARGVAVGEPLVKCVYDEPPKRWLPTRAHCDGQEGYIDVDDEIEVSKVIFGADLGWPYNHGECPDFKSEEITFPGQRPLLKLFAPEEIHYERFDTHKSFVGRFAAGWNDPPFGGRLEAEQETPRAHYSLEPSQFDALASVYRDLEKVAAGPCRIHGSYVEDKRSLPYLYVKEFSSPSVVLSHSLPSDVGEGLISLLGAETPGSVEVGFEGGQNILRVRADRNRRRLYVQLNDGSGRGRWVAFDLEWRGRYVAQLKQNGKKPLSAKTTHRYFEGFVNKTPVWMVLDDAGPRLVSIERFER